MFTFIAPSPLCPYGLNTPEAASEVGIQGCDPRNRGRGVRECERDGWKVYEEDIIKLLAIVGN